MDENLAVGVRVRQVCSAQVMGTFGGGGAQRLAYNLAVGLAEQGVRSIAIALRTAGSYGDVGAKEIELVALGADAHKPLSLIRAFLRLRRFIRRERIVLLHVHGAPSLPFVVLATRFMRGRPRLVFTWHDSERVLEEGRIRKRLIAWAMQHCDAVSGSSGRVAQKLRDRAVLDQVDVFHGGVPVFRESGPREKETPMIVWLGRIVPPKDPEILVRAVARLRAEGFRFSVCILGEPIPTTVWYMDKVRALIVDLGLADIVSTPGFALNDELQRVMRQAGIGVQTSHTEGLSLALLECMMSGQAVVATDVGDTATAIEDGVTGLLIPPRDELSLTDALRRLLSDPKLRLRLGGEARRRAIERFSIQAMARRAAKQYSTLLG